MDTISRGGLAGLIGSVGDVAVHHLGFFLWRTSTMAHYISQLIFPQKPVTPVRYIYGLSAHFFAGSFVGVILARILEHWGHANAYWKALGHGGLLGLIHVAVIPNLVSPRPYLHRTELEAPIDLLAHMAFVLLAAWYLRKTFRPSAA